MTQRDLGTLGESTLVNWAAARGISAQKATDDRYGWDYLLEFPPARENNIPDYPQDREPASISCLVQVKSTGTGDLNRQVELPRWQRLITQPLPAFFLVLDFEEDVVAQAAYLVPIDSASIHRVLRRIRELDSQSQDITKHTISILCREGHRLKAPDGESLEQAIRNHIGPSFEGYVRRKLEMVETAGYNSHRYQVTFEISIDESQGINPLEYLVDLSLGLRESLPINRAEFRDVRFGIPARMPERELSAGEIEIIPEPVEAVEVVLSRGIHVVRTTMEMFLPRGLPVKEILTAGLLKVFLKNEHLSFVICGTSMSMNFHIPDGGEAKRLCNLYELAKVALFFEECTKGPEKVTIYVRSESRIFYQNNFNLHGMVIPAAVVRFAENVRNAWEIAKRLDVQGKVESTVDMLLSQEERFRILWSLLASEKGRMKISWFWTRRQVDSSMRVCVPFGVEVILGDLKGTMLFSVWGDAQYTGLEQEGLIQCEIVTSERRLERTFTTRRGEEGLSLNAAVHAVADAQDDVTCLILEQYALPPASSNVSSSG